jgi:aldose sugar dehydrogenase
MGLTRAGLAAGLVIALLSGGCGSGGSDQPREPEGAPGSGDDTHSYRVETLAEGFEHPWAMAFLPDGRVLVTERPGRLNLVDLETGARVRVGGLPDIFAQGQGGLLDVALHPQFAATALVYLSYSATGSGGSALHVGRGRLEAEQLVEFEVLHVATPFVDSEHHYGSRLAFDSVGHLYVTVGDRRERDRAQELDDQNGATLRLTADGEIPADNPFVGRDGDDAIYSYGHRNSQGMVVHPQTGRIWQNEHGPLGGDEINVIEAGGNYGWPLTSLGREYDDESPIGPDSLEGTEAPIYHWQDSMGPSGMTFYTGEAFPRWYGNLFMGALAERNLVRLIVQGEEVVSEERLLEDRDWRVRDVRTGPDGYLYLLIDADEAPLVRLVPD